MSKVQTTTDACAECGQERLAVSPERYQKFMSMVAVAVISSSLDEVEDLLYAHMCEKLKIEPTRPKRHQGGEQ